MKKITSTLLGLTLALGTFAFAQSTDSSKKDSTMSGDTMGKSGKTKKSKKMKKGSASSDAMGTSGSTSGSTGTGTTKP